MDDDEGPVPKPDELLALGPVTAELFGMLRSWFEVPAAVELDLTEVDSAVAELGDPVLIAAMAMRKLQALHLLATPGVRTTTDVVVSIVGDLQRALVQAPVMRLRRAAATADWDAELELLTDGHDVLYDGLQDEDVGPETDDSDVQADRFRQLHALVNRAMEATVEASEGRIRTLL